MFIQCSSYIASIIIKKVIPSCTILLMSTVTGCTSRRFAANFPATVLHPSIRRHPRQLHGVTDSVHARRSPRPGRHHLSDQTSKQCSKFYPLADLLLTCTHWRCCCHSLHHISCSVCTYLCTHIYRSIVQLQLYIAHSVVNSRLKFSHYNYIGRFINGTKM